MSWAIPDEEKDAAKKIFYRKHALERIEGTKISQEMVEAALRDRSCFIEQDGDRVKHEKFPVAVVFKEKEDSFIVITAYKILPSKIVK